MKADEKLAQVRKASKKYAESHPKSEITIRRKNAVTIWIRVVDPDFKGQSRADRHDLLWSYIDKLPSEVRDDISILLPVTPAESKKLLLSHEFDE